MAKYRNNKPGVLGLTLTNQKTEDGKQAVGGTARTVGPGEVFEAEASEVPQHYLTQGWIVEAGKDERVGPPQLDEGEPSRTTADQPLTPPAPQTADAQRTATATATATGTTTDQQRAEQQRASALHDKSETGSEDKRKR